MDALELNPAVANELGVWHWNKPIDIRHAAQFHAEALAAIKTGMKSPIILDLSDASHLDACGLQILVALAVEALTVGRLFEIVKVSGAIERDLQLAGVNYLMRQE